MHDVHITTFCMFVCDVEQRFLPGRVYLGISYVGMALVRIGQWTAAQGQKALSICFSILEDRGTGMFPRPRSDGSFGTPHTLLCIHTFVALGWSSAATPCQAVRSRPPVSRPVFGFDGRSRVTAKRCASRDHSLGLGSCPSGPCEPESKSQS